jgi:3,4-dihydroxy 2-butanone 4-phosphate synthase
LNITKASKSLRQGDFVLIHDAVDRENETDLVVLAEKVEPRHIAQMRVDAGGLICVALHPNIAKNIRLPYMTEVYGAAAHDFKVLAAAEPDDIPYDERSAFSISVNHRKTYTGITDVDRALTIRGLGLIGKKAMVKRMMTEFGKSFRSPGHVPLLRAVDGLVMKRQGHTELACTLAEMAGVTPVLAICEMLDSRTSKALRVKDSIRYAEERGLVHLDGFELVNEYKKWLGKKVAK